MSHDVVSLYNGVQNMFSNSVPLLKRAIANLSPDSHNSILHEHFFEDFVFKNLHKILTFFFWDSLH